MRAFVASLILAGLVACGPDLPDAKTPGGVNGALAKELDPGPMTPVWKTIPEAARKDLESGAARSNPVEASRGRLDRAKLAWDLDDEARLHARFRGFLEALFMLEPVAFGPPSPDHDEAETLLLRFWSAARSFKQLAKAVDVNGQARGDAALDPALLIAISDQSEKQVRYFAARVLGHGGFEAEDLEIVAVAFETSEDPAHAKKIWDEIQKRAPGKLRTRDWLSIARVSLAVDDPKAAADATARAKPLAVAKSNDEADLLEARKLDAAVRWMERHIRAVGALSQRAKGTGVDAELAKADLLSETGRSTEAKARYEALAKQFPDDARVRVRRSQQIFSGFGEGVSLFEAADRAYTYLHRPGLAGEDLELASWSLGLTGTLGMQILASAGNQPDPKAYLKNKFPGLLIDLGKANASLAKFDPGRAAVNTFLLERTNDIVGADQPEATLAKNAPGWLVEVRKLLAQYPKTDDVYRLFYAMAAFAGDEAPAIIATMPPESGDDVEVFVQRASVASMMAALKMTREWIDLAKKTAEEIPATDDDGNEGLRAALRADATSLGADAAKNVEQWRTATRLYEVARDHVKSKQRARVLDNLGFALQSQGLGAEAMTAWQESSNYQHERKWVPIMNAAFVQATDKASRLALIGELEKAFADAKRDVPPLVHAWKAELSDEPVKSQEAKVYTEAVDASILHISRTMLGHELEGNFNLRMGVTTTKRTHVLDVSFGAVLWLAPNPTLDQAALKKLATPAPKKK